MHTQGFTRRVALGIVAAFALSLTGHAQTQLPPVGITAPTPLENLSAEIAEYRQHALTLANPFFEGRAPGTRGNRLAADYLQFKFERLGLLPAFSTTETDEQGASVTRERSTFRQPFEAPRSLRPGDSVRLIEQKVEFRGGKGGGSLKADSDFSVLGFSGSGDITAPVVFVGYSVNASARGYTTYPEGADLTGKIAVMYRFEPMDQNGRSQWAPTRWSPAAGLDQKFNEAFNRGAAGVILVNPPGAADERVNQLGDLATVPTTRWRHDKPVVMMRHEAFDRLLASSTSPTTAADLRKAADEKGVIIDIPGVEVDLTTRIEQVPTMTDNVGAILPGRGTLANEVLVIGAHYDHVGYGYFGSRDPNPRGKLHPGADDNASGTSGVLLLASMLKKSYDNLPEDAPARTVLFLLFSAEESGLNGSRYYVANPVFSREQTTLMINLDMIGRLREDKLELSGVGTAPGLDALCEAYYGPSGLQVAAKRSGFGPSDHQSFTAGKIPVLFFFTTLHREYHTPADTADTLNIEGAVRVVDLVHRIAFDVATRPEKLVFNEGERPVRPEPTAAPAEVAAPAGIVNDAPAPPRGRARVRFGIMPDNYDENVEGVLVGDVTDNTPAAKAGIKKGDVLLAWNDDKITNMQSFQDLLVKANPGDVVRIRLKRGEKEETLEVTLEARNAAPQ